MPIICTGLFFLVALTFTNKSSFCLCFFSIVFVLLRLKDAMLSGKTNDVRHAFVVLLCQTAFLKQEQIDKNQINTTKAFYLKNHSARKVIILFLRSVIMIYKSIMKDVNAEFH